MGEKYRHEVLSHGGGKPPKILVQGKICHFFFPKSLLPPDIHYKCCLQLRNLFDIYALPNTYLDAMLQFKFLDTFSIIILDETRCEHLL